MVIFAFFLVYFQTPQSFLLVYSILSVYPIYSSETIETA